MEDRLFEPMLVAGTSQVNLRDRLYVNFPATIFLNYQRQANYSIDNHS
jgi:hypothetical protein